MNSNVGSPPIPNATFPRHVTEELQSAEAKVWKVADETASVGTATKKKNKRSAHTAVTESSPNPRPVSTTAMPSITDPAVAPVAATDIVRTNAHSVKSEMDGIIAGGMLWEDAFGGMTLDEDVAAQQVGVVASRPDSVEAMFFPSTQTPQQQQYSMSGEGAMNLAKVTPHTHHHNNHNNNNTQLTHATDTFSDTPKTFRCSQSSAVRLAPLDTPLKAPINVGGDGGTATTRKSFSEAMSGGGGGQPVEAEEAEGKKKDDMRMRVGYYQMDKKHHVRYVFIPKAMLRNPQFDFDEAFAALQITVPDLIFDLNSAPDVDEWNLRLPDEYKHLQTKEMYNPEDKTLGISRMLLHYQGE